MSKSYTVSFAVTVEGTIEVEAQDESEARKEAESILETGGCDFSQALGLPYSPSGMDVWDVEVNLTECERVVKPIECVACGRKVKPRDGEVTLCACGALLTTDQD